MKVKNLPLEASGVLGDVTPALADQIPSGGSANYASSLSGSRQRNVGFPKSSLSPHVDLNGTRVRYRRSELLNGDQAHYRIGSELGGSACGVAR